MKLKPSLYLLLPLILLPACNFVNKKTGASGEQLNVQSSEITFSLVKENIFSPRCISCHQQYESYGLVKNELPAILAAVAADRMPKSGGPLTDAQKSLLMKWADLGAPENSSAAPTVPSDPSSSVLEPNWKSVSENIFVPRCLVCHSPNGQAKFLDLSSRQVIFSARNQIFGAGAGKKLLDFDAPANSYILEVIQDPVEPMPPIWSNIRRLNQAEIDVLTQWIGLGLP